MFLAFLYPVEIPGVRTDYFLKSAVISVRKHSGEAEIDSMSFINRVKEKMALLMDAESMITLHRELWSCPADELAEWWRLAMRQYNLLTAAPTTAHNP